MLLDFQRGGGGAEVEEAQWIIPEGRHFAEHLGHFTETLKAVFLDAALLWS